MCPAGAEPPVASSVGPCAGTEEVSQADGDPALVPAHPDNSTVHSTPTATHGKEKARTLTPKWGREPAHCLSNPPSIRPSEMGRTVPRCAPCVVKTAQSGGFRHLQPLDRSVDGDSSPALSLPRRKPLPYRQVRRCTPPSNGEKFTPTNKPPPVAAPSHGGTSDERRLFQSVVVRATRTAPLA